MRSKQKGFSLIELLIVVAIILIIAAIAIPNLLRSKIAANQASAVASLRTLNTSSVLYNTNYQMYPSSIASMGTAATVTSASADLIDAVLSAGQKSGYDFTWSGGGTGATTYAIAADPLTTSSGTVHYYTDQSLVIRSNSTTTATINDLPIGN
jgi:prepilin-type N-terminal cleavage/methylation domain-containing protein